MSGHEQTPEEHGNGMWWLVASIIAAGGAAAPPAVHAAHQHMRPRLPRPEDVAADPLAEARILETRKAKQYQRGAMLKVAARVAIEEGGSVSKLDLDRSIGRPHSEGLHKNQLINGIKLLEGRLIERDVIDPKAPHLFHALYPLLEAARRPDEFKQLADAMAWVQMRLHQID